MMFVLFKQSEKNSEFWTRSIVHAFWLFSPFLDLSFKTGIYVEYLINEA